MKNRPNVFSILLAAAGSLLGCLCAAAIMGGSLLVWMALGALFCVPAVCFWQQTDRRLKICFGLLGMAFFWLYTQFEPEGGHTWLLALFILVGTMILIWVCNIFWPGGVQPGGVVLCIVMFNTPVASYVSYSLNRIFDTAVGVLLAWAVSYLIPRDCKKVWGERIARWKAKKAQSM